MKTQKILYKRDQHILVKLHSQTNGCNTESNTAVKWFSTPALYLEDSMLYLGIKTSYFE
jgi:hypothetical protein